MLSQGVVAQKLLDQESDRGQETVGSQKVCEAKRERKAWRVWEIQRFRSKYFGRTRTRGGKKKSPRENEEYVDEIGGGNTIKGTDT